MGNGSIFLNKKINKIFLPTFKVLLKLQFLFKKFFYFLFYFTSDDILLERKIPFFFKACFTY